MDINELFEDSDFEDAETDEELNNILHPEKYAQAKRRRAILEHVRGPRETRDF